jgi:hypothetical protein
MDWVYNNTILAVDDLMNHRKAFDKVLRPKTYIHKLFSSQEPDLNEVKRMINFLGIPPPPVGA